MAALPGIIFSMLEKLSFPILYVVDFVVSAAIVAAFAGIAHFLFAKPIASLDLKGKVLPATWEAAVPSHGRFYEGFLIGNHPFAFALCLILLLSAAAAYYPIVREERARSLAEGAPGQRRHRWAQVCVLAALAFVAYLITAATMVSVAPLAP